MIDVDTSATLETINRFYSDPKNLPVRWDHAVVIAEAMVSGVKVAENQLEVIRELDAKTTAMSR